MNKRSNYRRGGFDMIPATAQKKKKEPNAVKKTAKRDLRVKGG